MKCKTKKNYMGICIPTRMSNFEACIWPENFIMHKPLISVECILVSRQKKIFFLEKNLYTIKNISVLIDPEQTLF